MSLCSQLFTYFSVTINNPDENDLLITRNPNEKYVRQCIWTHETGNEGTPHVQMWLRLFRNNSLSLVKKLYPRAHIRGIAKDEYNENTHAYAQKDDDTTRGAHVITSSNAPHDALSVMQDLFRVVQENDTEVRRLWAHFHEPKLLKLIREVEHELVMKKPYLAKFFVSAGYKAMFKEFGEDIFNHLVHERRQQQTNKQTADSGNNVSPPGINGTHQAEDSSQEEGCTSPSGSSVTSAEDSDL